MSKRKAGLHKKISSIFDGVPLPNKDNLRQTPSETPPSATGIDVSLKTPGAASQAAEDLHGRQAASAAKGRGLRQGVSEQVMSKPPVSRGEGKTKRQVVTVMLIPLLSAIFVLLLVRAFKTPPLHPRLPAPKPLSAKTVDWKIPGIYPAALRDPMEIAVSGDPCELTVTAVIIDEQDPSASITLIGGRTVRVGDTVAGAKVVEINKNNIVFEKNGLTWTQNVGPAK